jgi:hypothetical protein
VAAAAAAIRRARDGASGRAGARGGGAALREGGGSFVRAAARRRTAACRACARRGQRSGHLRVEGAAVRDNEAEHVPAAGGAEGFEGLGDFGGEELPQRRGAVRRGEACVHEGGARAVLQLQGVLARPHVAHGRLGVAAQLGCLRPELGQEGLDGVLLDRVGRSLLRSLLRSVCEVFAESACFEKLPDLWMFVARAPSSPKDDFDPFHLDLIPLLQITIFIDCWK